MTGRRSAAWMFEDYPEGNWLRDFQLINTAFTRIAVVAVHKPLRPVVRAIALILSRKDHG